MTGSGKHQLTRQPESPRTRPVLVVIGGLPATGKSTAGRAAAHRLGATYLRIDTIRQSLFTFSAPGADTDAVRIDRCPHFPPLNLSLRTPQYPPEHTSGRLKNSISLKISPSGA
ncbi:AAA family ATPase [Streptomyces albidoflavus]